MEGSAKKREKNPGQELVRALLDDDEEFVSKNKESKENEEKEGEGSGSQKKFSKDDEKKFKKELSSATPTTEGVKKLRQWIMEHPKFGIAIMEELEQIAAKPSQSGKGLMKMIVLYTVNDLLLKVGSMAKAEKALPFDYRTEWAPFFEKLFVLLTGPVVPQKVRELALKTMDSWIEKDRLPKDQLDRIKEKVQLQKMKTLEKDKVPKDSLLPAENSTLPLSRHEKEAVSLNADSAIKSTAKLSHNTNSLGQNRGESAVQRPPHSEGDVLERRPERHSRDPRERERDLAWNRERGREFSRGRGPGSPGGRDFDRGHRPGSPGGRDFDRGRGPGSPGGRDFERGGRDFDRGRGPPSWEMDRHERERMRVMDFYERDRMRDRPRSPPRDWHLPPRERLDQRGRPFDDDRGSFRGPPFRERGISFDDREFRGDRHRRSPPRGDFPPYLMRRSPSPMRGRRRPRDDSPGRGGGGGNNNSQRGKRKKKKGGPKGNGRSGGESGMDLIAEGDNNNGQSRSRSGSKGEGKDANDASGDSVGGREKAKKKRKRGGRKTRRRGMSGKSDEAEDGKPSEKDSNASKVEGANGNQVENTTTTDPKVKSKSSGEPQLEEFMDFE